MRPWTISPARGVARQQPSSNRVPAASPTQHPQPPKHRSSLPAAIVSEWDPSAACCSRRRLGGWPVPSSLSGALVLTDRSSGSFVSPAAGPAGPGDRLGAGRARQHFGDPRRGRARSGRDHDRRRAGPRARWRRRRRRDRIRDRRRRRDRHQRPRRRGRGAASTSQCRTARSSPPGCWAGTPRTIWRCYGLTRRSCPRSSSGTPTRSRWATTSSPSATRSTSTVG